MLRIGFVTLFPEMVLGAVGHSILKRAQDRSLVAFDAANPRDFAYDAHRTVDDKPYGGGPGMVMKVEPVAAALEWLLSRESASHSAVVLTDPTGIRFDQPLARELSRNDRVVFLCGHYEGIDDRIRQLATHVVSLGDYVLTGGELPALVMADAVARLVPGVLGEEGSLEIDSHSGGLLSAPQFTRPEVWRGVPVPEEVRSGDHRAMERWKRRQALTLTRQNRPDLFARASLEKLDLDLLSSEVRD